MSVHAAAAAFAAACSGLVAPAITLATAGRGEQPGERELEQRVAVVRSPSRRALRRGRSSCRRTPARVARPACPRAACPRAAASLRWYLPVSMPLASGKYGMNASAVRSRTRRARRCCSGPRRSRLYSFCTLTKRAESALGADRARSRRSARREKLLPPISSTLPARTSSSSATSVSSNGVAVVGEVQLVQVDAVGAEPPQAVFARARLMYAARRAALALLVDRSAELRRDQRLVAPRAERAAEELLAQRAAVDVGGVEQRDAGVERGVDDALWSPPRRCGRRSCCSRARPP